MTKPNFLFLGPSKTASTYLYKMLLQHPCFSLPSTKDIYYFDQFYMKGDDWYINHFKNCDNSKIIGEFSHDYICNQVALSRILSFDKTLKLIVCLRNPYLRTESGIKFLRRNGYGFEELSILINNYPELIEGSLYGKNLSYLLSIFSSNNILLLDFDDLLLDPRIFLKKVYNFFGVSEFYPDNIYSVINKAKQARHPSISYMAKHFALKIRRYGFNTIPLYLSFPYNNISRSLQPITCLSITME